MSELKATPGPWEALPSHIRLTGETSRTKFPDGRWVINPENDFERVPLAEVDQGDDLHPPTRKQAEYNAYLIAAAPELYEAVNGLLEALPSSTTHPAIKAARAALAKARGEP